MTDDVGGAEKTVHSILTDVKTRVQAVQQAQTELIAAESNRVEHAEKVTRFVADRVDGARYANRQNAQTNAYTFVVETELDHASRSLPEPSEQSQTQIIEKLQLALSDKETDKIRLAATNEMLRMEAIALRSQTTNLTREVSDRQIALNDKTVELTRKTDALVDVEAKERFHTDQLEKQRQIADAERGSKLRMRIAAVFMAFGGIVLVAGLVAAYLHVPGVLLPAMCAGAGSFAFGFFVSWIEKFTDSIWFKVGVGVVVLGGLGLLAWLGYRAMQTRKTATLDEQISNTTIGAIQDLRNDDERFGLSRFADTLKPYLEAWHTTSDGLPHPDIRREINQRLVKKNYRDAGKKTATVMKAPITTKTLSELGRRAEAGGAAGLVVPSHPTPAETKPPVVSN